MLLNFTQYFPKLAYSWFSDKCTKAGCLCIILCSKGDICISNSCICSDENVWQTLITEERQGWLTVWVAIHSVGKACYVGFHGSRMWWNSKSDEHWQTTQAKTRSGSDHPWDLPRDLPQVARSHNSRDSNTSANSATRWGISCFKA